MAEVTTQEFERLITRVDKLLTGQGEIKERLIALESSKSEELRRVADFYKRDWDPMTNRVACVEKSIRELEAFKWKAVGMVGGAGIVGGGVGAFLMDLVVQTILNGG